MCKSVGLKCGHTNHWILFLFLSVLLSIFWITIDGVDTCTGKSLSEALILESINPKYDDRLFIDLQLQYKKNTSSEHVVYKNCFECQNKNKNNICTQHVLKLYFPCTKVSNQ